MKRVETNGYDKNVNVRAFESFVRVEKTNRVSFKDHTRFI